MTDETNQTLDTQIDTQVQSGDVSKMKNSDIRYRAKYKETFAELEQMKASKEREEKELFAKMSVLEKDKNSAIQKRVDAEIKAAAVNAGLNDLDLIKLMDREKITIDANGDPSGIPELLESFKNEKPAYFSEPKKTSSSSNAEMVKAPVAARVNAWDMTKEQFEEYKRNLIY